MQVFTPLFPLFCCFSFSEIKLVYTCGMFVNCKRSSGMNSRVCSEKFLNILNANYRYLEVGSIGLPRKSFGAAGVKVSHAGHILSNDSCSLLSPPNDDGRRLHWVAVGNFCAHKQQIVEWGVFGWMREYPNEVGKDVENLRLSESGYDVSGKGKRIYAPSV